MKLKHFSLFAVYLSAFLIFSSFNHNPGDRNEVILRELFQEMNSAHLQPMEANDAFSIKFFDHYIKSLDGNKRFFTQKDIDELKKYRTQLDDQINSGSYEFFEKSLEIVNNRVKQVGTFYKEFLDKPFDFTTDETMLLDGKKAVYASDDNELKENWRKSLKYQVMVRLSESMDEQEKAVKKNDSILNLKSIDAEKNKTSQESKSLVKKDSLVKILTFAEMEADARKKVLKSQDSWYKRLAQVEKSDRVGAYLNAMAETYDPHSNYFPPKEKEAFDISMTGRLEGIGATLQERDGYIRVQNIVPGSASWKQGQLKVGDIILKVAQGADEPVDIVDMNLDNAVKLIRGKKGTEVRLSVKKVDGSIVVIPIIRDVVMIEETFAKSAILKDNKKNVGYIKLPGFYADFNRNGGRNCATDVKNEIAKLKKENVDGIILDLRDNGGGSLEDAVNMAGLFIEKGPIVQVKSRFGLPQMLEDRDPTVFYSGPLVVMVNSLSASASEILAAAMQDYKRGIIMGSASTYGKGTVQRMMNLDDYVASENDNLKPLGSIKVTIQKFYRINGGATQLKGVIPDIIFPDKYAYIDMGEKEQDYAMPWNEISPAKYTQWDKNDPNIEKVKKASRSRIERNPVFKLIDEEGLKLKKQMDDSKYSLNLQNFRAEQKKLKMDAQKFEEIEKAIPGFDASLSMADAPTNVGDTLSELKTKQFLKTLKKDAYLFEAFHVISETQKK